MDATQAQGCIDKAAQLLRDFAPVTKLTITPGQREEFKGTFANLRAIPEGKFPHLVRNAEVWRRR